MKERTQLILKFAKPHKWKFVLLFTCIMVTSFTGALYPYIFGKLVDEVFYNKNMSIFLNIVLIYGAIYLFNQIMHFVLNMTWANLMTRFLFDIRHAIFNKVLSYKGTTLSGIYSGDIISRMSGDTEQFMNFIHWNVFYFTSGIVSLILSIGFILYINWQLAILAVIITPITVYLSRKYAKKVRIYYAEMAEKNGLLSSWLFEMIKGMGEIKLLCATKNILAVYFGGMHKVAKIQIKANKVEVVSERVNAGIALFNQMLLYIIAAIFIIKGNLTVGGFIACADYFRRSISFFSTLNDRFSGIAGNMVSIDRVANILKEDSENYNDNIPPNKIHNGDIEFEDVTFSYNCQVNVLDGVSLIIKSGEKVSLVGQSGAGKSTMANLIYKLYDLKSGCIRIDKIDINNYNLHSLREQIGIVHQETILFDGSIRYNLIFTKENYTDELIWAALKMAHLDEFVKDMPEGLDTILGYGGISFSGGQKQRLAIARLFIKNPKILIFDEATSSLDNEAESAITEAWDELCKGRTIIIIAHRLSTIINSDKVAVIMDGKIAGYDNHKCLLNSCKAYQKLFKEQYNLDMEVTHIA